MSGTTSVHRGRGVRKALCLAVLAVTCLLSAWSAGSAQAALPFSIAEVDGGLYRNAQGDPAIQAGSHPYAGNAFIRFAASPGGAEEGEMGIEFPNAAFKDVITKLPPGLIGSPLATPRCAIEVFDRAKVGQPSECPEGTAVGRAAVQIAGLPYALHVPVYNLPPSHGEPALFGFRVLSATILLKAGLLTGPEPAVTISSLESSQALPIVNTEVILWGVPADPAHDGERGKCVQLHSGPDGGSCKSDAPMKPFISMPTSCSGPITTTLRANAWLEEDNWSEMSFLSEDREGNPVGIEGCELLGFSPTLRTAMEPRAAATPSALDVDLAVPQNETVEGLATAHLKKAVVQLPVGVALNSAAADGLGACSMAEVGLERSAPAQCPPSSRVGTVKVTTPLLEEQLNGSLFLAKQNENPFGSMYAIYLVIDDPALGIYVKVAGKVDVDPQSGQITTTFDSNPQVPFDRLQVSFASGPRSPLRTPEACGTYETKYSLTSWSGKTVNGSNSLVIDSNCGKQNQFTPGFDAGTTNSAGGAFSAFNLRLTREDGQQNLASLNVTMPEGLTAKLAGVPLCPDAAAATGACPAASQVGTTTVGSGAGTSPIYVPQPGREPTALYLAGPYKGGPYSLVAKVPAQAGPFDLGTVTVRNAIYVDPTTAQVSVKSDPLPQILQGIPISYRDVRVEVNRPEFTLNATSCDPMTIAGTIGSAGGATADRSSRYQAVNCANLGFKPKLKLSLTGQMKRSGNPALRAVMTQPAGGANIDQVQVILPKTAFIDNAHINNPCTRAQYAAEACPAKSVLGTVEARTPLLDEPLRGKVYFRANGGERELPDIVAALRGQIAVDLVGYIDSVQNKKQGTSRVRTTFAMVPDAPVARFEMNLKGGKVGLIENSANLCKVKANKATVLMDGQNGRVHDTAPLLGTSCGKKAKRK